jgi:hypothetical protein
LAFVFFRCAYCLPGAQLSERGLYIKTISAEETWTKGDFNIPPAPEQKSATESFESSFFVNRSIAFSISIAAIAAGDAFWMSGSLWVHSAVRRAWHLEQTMPGVLVTTSSAQYSFSSTEIVPIGVGQTVTKGDLQTQVAYLEEPLRLAGNEGVEPI